MFGSAVLDTALGLAFVYVLLSLICSALREAIEARLKSRAVHLERGIREMLRGDAAQLTRKLYEHPLLYSLYQGEYTTPVQARYTGMRWLGAAVRSWFSRASTTNLPSYVPARNFARALLDIAGRGEVAGADRETEVAPELSVDTVRQNLARNIPSPYLRRVVLGALDGAQGNLDVVIERLAAWYDSTMDRVSGWYKRESQHILFWLGMMVTVILNVDTLTVVRHLAASEQARAALVGQALAAAQDASVWPSADGNREHTASASQGTGESSGIGPADRELAALRERLSALNLPIGWGEIRPGAPKSASCVGPDPAVWCVIWPYDVSRLAPSVIGWLLTAFAISFGAPFWFDLLNKMMVIRSTVKPHEKSPEEGSEDRVVTPLRAAPPLPRRGG